jgi:periplasmic copper chaperone A
MRSQFVFFAGEFAMYNRRGRGPTRRVILFAAKKGEGMSIRTISLLILTLFFSACNTKSAPRVVVQETWVKQAKVSEITAGDLNQTCICERVTATNAYLRIINRGGAADRLVRVETDAALQVELHKAGVAEAFSSPVVLDGMDIPKDGNVDFAPGSYAMVLKNLRGDLKPGDEVKLSLFFEKTGKVEVAAKVR